MASTGWAECVKAFKRILVVFSISLFLVAAYQDFAEARAGSRGGGGFSSYGSRGSRTYSAPARPSPSNTYNYNQSRAQQAPAPQPIPQAAPPAGGGFMRAMAGGIIGGMIGSLLFSSLGHAGFGPTGGFGIGILDIALIGILLFLAFRFFRSRQSQQPQPAGFSYGNNGGNGYQHRPGPVMDIPPAEGNPRKDDFLAGLGGIRKLDPSFEEESFNSTAIDIFFRVQSAWMERDLAPVRSLLSADMLKAMGADIERMKREGRINRVERTAIRDTEITEAWQEEGNDFITLKIAATAIDYVTDESGKVLEGNNKEAERFVEYWTFVRKIGVPDWTLTAIQQEN